MAGKTVLKAVRDDGVELQAETAEEANLSDVPASIPYDPLTGKAQIPGDTPVNASEVAELVAKAASVPGGVGALRKAFGLDPVTPTAPIATLPGFSPGKTVNIITDRNQILIGLEKARLLGAIDRGQYNEMSAMKEVLEAEEQRVFFVQPDPLNPKLRVIESSINGYRYLIPLGQPVSAPQSIFEILLRAGLAQPQRPSDLPRCPVVAPSVRAAIEQQYLSEGDTARILVQGGV